MDMTLAITGHRQQALLVVNSDCFFWKETNYMLRLCLPTWNFDILLRSTPKFPETRPLS